MRTTTSTRTAGVFLTAALVAASLLSGATAAQAVDDPPGDVHVNSLCDARWHYKNTGLGATRFTKVGREKFAYNGTRSTALVTFTSSSNRMIGATVGSSLNVGVYAVIASANSEFHMDLHASMELQRGVEAEIRVPKKRTGVGQYGVYKAHIRGSEWYENRSCTTSKRHKTSVYSPYRDGWKTWVE